MSKKMKLVEAASRVVLLNGVSQLTLEAVAIEANVSKGGLQYHFPTKDELIIAMNVRVIEQFRRLIEEGVAAGYSFHESYLLATLTSLKDSDFLNINTSLLAAVSTNPVILNLWKEEYKIINERFAKERCEPGFTLLVQTVSDGLWFSKMFNITHVEIVEAQRLIEYVLSLSMDQS